MVFQIEQSIKAVFTQTIRQKSVFQFLCLLQEDAIAGKKGQKNYSTHTRHFALKTELRWKMQIGSFQWYRLISRLGKRLRVKLSHFILNHT